MHELLQHRLYVEGIKSFHLCYLVILSLWPSGKICIKGFRKRSPHVTWMEFTFNSGWNLLTRVVIAIKHDLPLRLYVFFIFVCFSAYSFLKFSRDLEFYLLYEILT